MAFHVAMRDPVTGRTETHTPQNALDLEQHRGWKRVSNVPMNDPRAGSAQDAINAAGSPAKSAPVSVALPVVAVEYEPPSAVPKRRGRHAKTAPGETTVAPPIEDADEDDDV